MPAEPSGARLGGEHAPGLAEQRLARMVEIVSVLVVAEQHGVDGAQLVCRQGRSRSLGQRDMRQRIVAGKMEGRIGKQPEAVDLDQRRRAADQGYAHR